MDTYGFGGGSVQFDLILVLFRGCIGLFVHIEGSLCVYIGISYAYAELLRGSTWL